jgi:hypothetical protein
MHQDNCTFFSIENGVWLTEMPYPPDTWNFEPPSAEKILSFRFTAFTPDGSFCGRGRRAKYGYLSVFHLHAVNKNHPFVSGFSGSPVVHAKHFFAIRRVGNAVVPRAGYLAAFVRVFFCNTGLLAAFLKGPSGDADVAYPMA